MRHLDAKVGCSGRVALFAEERTLVQLQPIDIDCAIFCEAGIGISGEKAKYQGISDLRIRTWAKLGDRKLQVSTRRIPFEERKKFGGHLWKLYCGRGEKTGIVEILPVRWQEAPDVPVDGDKVDGGSTCGKYAAVPVAAPGVVHRRRVEDSAD